CARVEGLERDAPWAPQVTLFSVSSTYSSSTDVLTRVQHELRAWFSDEGVLIVGRVVAEYWELIIVEERILK
ncbi:hypothetical protein Dimus_019958, partial [Dionaea muscipula]